jgi:hypothetical protein
MGTADARAISAAIKRTPAWLVSSPHLTYQRNEHGIEDGESDLGFFERIVGVPEDGAGIDHVPVQKEAEEIIAQIVVRLNITAAAHDRNDDTDYRIRLLERPSNLGALDDQAVLCLCLRQCHQAFPHQRQALGN